MNYNFNNLQLSTSIHTFVRTPTWRSEPYPLTYIIVNKDINSFELISLINSAVSLKLPNPRIVTTNMLRWYSLFHPRLFKLISVSHPVPVRSYRWAEERLSSEIEDLSLVWLQSMLFLTSVTISTNIVQNHISTEMINSKLDSLWDAGTLANLGIAAELKCLDLHNRVSELSINSANDITKLFSIRKLFIQALDLIRPKSGVIKTLKKTLRSFPDGRFDFICYLQNLVGTPLHGIIVYGTSITSDKFTDIDIIAIVDDAERALLALAGKSPIWQGKKLDIGIYTPSEFLTMQYLSGDNMSSHSLCIWGEVNVVHKPSTELLVRQFSFGIIRQRQQLRVLGQLLTNNEQYISERLHLCDYFVKLPANVVKGVFSVIDRPISKEKAYNWLRNNIGISIAELQKQISSKNIIEALATSALSTDRALIKLNDTLGLIYS